MNLSLFDIRRWRPSRRSTLEEIDEEFRRIGVRVKMTATGAELARVLYAIEAGPIFLFVDNLDVRTKRARRNQPIGKDPALRIRVNFFGYLRPDVE